MPVFVMYNIFMNNKKHLLYLLIAVAVLSLIIVTTQFAKKTEVISYAVNFEECVANGNLVMESYPRQCTAGNGTVFVEVIDSTAVDQNIADEFNPKSPKGEDYETIETVQFSVASQKRGCGSFSRQPCLVVNGENLYDPIDGFEYEPGYEYKITVEKYLRFGTSDPQLLPQDIGMFAYRLVSVDSKDSVETKTEDATVTPNNPCRITGCSSQLCVSADAGEVLSTCEFLPQYQCFKDSICEVQVTGECGWTETEKFTQCVESFTNNEI